MVTMIAVRETAVLTCPGWKRVPPSTGGQAEATESESHQVSKYNGQFPETYWTEKLINNTTGMKSAKYSLWETPEQTARFSMKKLQGKKEREIRGETIDSKT